MPDYNLLGLNPASVNTQIQPVNDVQNMQNAFTLGNQKVKAEEAVQGQQDDQQWRKEMQDYLVKGGDLTTPDGIKKALTDLKGKIPVDKYFGLAQHYTQAQQADLKFQESLAALPEAQAKLMSGEINTAGPLLDQLSEAYKKNLAESGSQDAQTFFDQGKAALLKQLQSDKRYTPDFVQHVAQGFTPESAAGFKEHMKGTKETLEENLRNQEIEQKKAMTEAAQNPGNWQQWIASDKSRYEYNPKINSTRKINPDGSRVEELSGLPPGAVQMTSKQGAELGLPEADKLSPEEGQLFAEYTATVGKPYPMLNLGMGNTQGRVQFLKSVAQLAKERGLSGAQLGDLSLQRDAAKLARANLFKQNAILTQTEVEIGKVLTNMEEEVKKAGGPDSPKMRSLLNHTLTDWVGDPRFGGINIDAAALIEQAGRLASNATGAAGTPVAFKSLAEQMTNRNMNLGQLLKAGETFKQVVAARHEGVDVAEKELNAAGALPPKKNDMQEGADKARAAPKDGKSIADVEYGNDINKARASLKEARTAFTQAKTSEQKDILKQQVDAASSAVDYLSKNAPKQLTSKSGVKFTVTTD